MSNALDSNRFSAARADVTSSLPTTAPQQGDEGTELLAKIAALLNTLQITSRQRSGVVYDEGGIARQVRVSAPANVAASQTDSPIIAAVAGYSIRVLSVYALAGGTATDLTFNSKPAGAGAAISPLLGNEARGGEVLGYHPHGHFRTLVGEGLSVTTGAGATTGLQVTYILVPAYLTDENGNLLLDENGIALTAPA